MPRYVPKALPGMVSAADVAIIGIEMTIMLLQPTIGVPTVIATLLLALARGATFLQYFALVSSIVRTVESLLSIFVHLKTLGLFGTPDDCCEQLKRIADYLRTVKPDETEESIAERLKIISEDLVWVSDDGTRFNLGESLGRILFTGVYHASTQP